MADEPHEFSFLMERTFPFDGFYLFKNLEPKQRLPIWIMEETRVNTFLEYLQAHHVSYRIRWIQMVARTRELPPWLHRIVVERLDVNRLTMMDMLAYNMILKVVTPNGRDYDKFTVVLYEPDVERSTEDQDDVISIESD